MRAEDLKPGRIYRHGDQGTRVRLLALDTRGRPLVTPSGWSETKKTAQKPIWILSDIEIANLEEVER